MPRMNVPGASYLVTRTTVNSLFLLVPSDVVNRIFEYCLARAAEQYGILLHAVSVESNHFHLMLTDPRGELSEFMQELNRTVSRCLIAHYRAKFPGTRLSTIWDPSQSYSAPVLVNKASVIKAIAYVLCNPVKDGLVRDYRKWPGFNTRPSQWLAGERVAVRPGYYFKHTAKRIAYRLVAPWQLGDDVPAAVSTMEERIRDEMTAYAREVSASKRGFLGAKAACKVNPFGAPTTPRPVGNLNPHLAAGGDAAAMREAVKALKAFRLAYREAWGRFKKGLHAVFPGGTLLMQKRYRVPCEPLDAACWCELATA